MILAKLRSGRYFERIETFGFDSDPLIFKH